MSTSSGGLLVMRMLGSLGSGLCLCLCVLANSYVLMCEVKSVSNTNRHCLKKKHTHNSILAL